MSDSVINKHLLQFPKAVLKLFIDQQLISSEVYAEYTGIFEFYQIHGTINKYPDRKPFYSAAPKGYFHKHFLELGSDVNPIKTAVRQGFNTLDAHDGLYIDVQEFERFVSQYNKTINLDWVAQETNVNWTNDIITKFNDVWEWDFLHTNPSIRWNYDLVRGNKDFVNWCFISSYEELNWTIKELREFKDDLVFSTSYLWGQYGLNKKGKSSKGIKQVRNGHHHFYKHLKGSMSLNETIVWSKEIIDELKDYWDWKELASNASIPWDSGWISLYENELDFKTLSANTKVAWNEDLINKYSVKWDWEILSGNPSLPWNSDFIRIYKDRWHFKPKSDYFLNRRKPALPASISTNTGIKWSQELLKEWNNEIDFWYIALLGKIDEKEVLLFNHEFQKLMFVDTSRHKYSDSYETAWISRTGWENLAINKNFSISKINIPFYLANEISKTSVEGNLADSGNYVTKDVPIFSLLITARLQDVTLADLIEPSSWSSFLLNNTFINQSIEQYLIGYFNLIERQMSYLEELKIMTDERKN